MKGISADVDKEEAQKWFAELQQRLDNDVSDYKYDINVDSVEG